MCHIGFINLLPGPIPKNNQHHIKKKSYFGKNNFYKIKNKKKSISAKNNCMNSKNNCVNSNIVDIAKTTKTTKTTFEKKSFLNCDQKKSKNLFRLFSIKLYIKNFILDFIKNICCNYDVIHNEQLMSELFIKIYKFFLFVTMIKYNLQIQTSFINTIANDVDIIYFIYLKNDIVDNNNDMTKFCKNIFKHMDFFIKKKTNVNVIIKIYEDEIFSNLKIKNNNNQCCDELLYLTIPTDKCAITLDLLENNFYYCTQCKAKYNFDGFEYWKIFSDGCCTKWCTNQLDNLYFCIKYKNIFGKKNTNLNFIITYYKLVYLIQ